MNLVLALMIGFNLNFGGGVIIGDKKKEESMVVQPQFGGGVIIGDKKKEKDN